jgi:hypothetical protein
MLLLVYDFFRYFEKKNREKVMMENLSSQLPTLDKYIGRIKRQQTEDKDCLKWDTEVSWREREKNYNYMCISLIERFTTSPGAKFGCNVNEISSLFGTHSISR